MNEIKGRGRNPNSMANLRMYQPGHAVDREMLSRAGRASAEAKKRRRQIREALKDILNSPLADNQNSADIISILSEMGIEAPTMADAIALAAIRKAFLGDIDAARFVRDSSGEKPSQKVELGIADTPIDGVDFSRFTDEQLIEMLMLPQN